MCVPVSLKLWEETALHFTVAFSRGAFATGDHGPNQVIAVQYAFSNHAANMNDDQT